MTIHWTSGCLISWLCFCVSALLCPCPIFSGSVISTSLMNQLLNYRIEKTVIIAVFLESRWFSINAQLWTNPIELSSCSGSKWTWLILISLVQLHLSTFIHLCQLRQPIYCYVASKIPTHLGHLAAEKCFLLIWILLTENLTS